MKVSQNDKLKERLLGTLVTIVTSAIMFVFYSFFGSFETKADSQKKYDIVNKKLDKVICYLDKTKCLD